MQPAGEGRHALLRRTQAAPSDGAGAGWHGWAGSHWCASWGTGTASGQQLKVCQLGWLGWADVRNPTNFELCRPIQLEIKCCHQSSPMVYDTPSNRPAVWVGTAQGQLDGC